MLSGIHYMRIATQVQMIALMNTMDDWLEQHPKVCFVNLSFVQEKLMALFR